MQFETSIWRRQQRRKPACRSSRLIMSQQKAATPCTSPPLKVSFSAKLPVKQQPQTSPLAPDLVLRVGFAGERQLDATQTETVQKRLRDVFSVIGWRLVEIAPIDDAVKERPVPSIARFYSFQHPTLRLIHGLCEGSDSIAFGVLRDLVMPALEKDFAAVVPFPLADYRSSRELDFLPEFDRQLDLCSYVVVPDGIYDKLDKSATPPSVSNFPTAAAPAPTAANPPSSSAKLTSLSPSSIPTLAENLAALWKPSAPPSISISPLSLSIPIPAKSSSLSPGMTYSPCSAATAASPWDGRKPSPPGSPKLPLIPNAPKTPSSTPAPVMATA